MGYLRFFGFLGLFALVLHSHAQGAVIRPDGLHQAFSIWRIIGNVDRESFNSSKNISPLHFACKGEAVPFKESVTFGVLDPVAFIKGDGPHKLNAFGECGSSMDCLELSAAGFSGNYAFLVSKLPTKHHFVFKSFDDGQIQFPINGYRPRRRIPDIRAL